MDGTHGRDGNGPVDPEGVEVLGLLRRLVGEVASIAESLANLERREGAAPTKSPDIRADMLGAGASAPAFAGMKSDDELRAKLAQLPVKMNTIRPTEDLRRAKLPRTPDYSEYQFPTIDLLDDFEGNYSEKMAAIVQE